MPKERLLVLTPRFPYPPLSGGIQLLMHVVRALEDHRLTLLSLCATREEMEFEPDDGIFEEIHRVYLPKFASYWNVLSSLGGRKPLQLAYYRSSAFRHKFEELLPRNDAVLAHLIRTGQYVAESNRNIPGMLLMSDAISLAYKRLAELPGTSLLWRVLARTELSRLLNYERNCPKSFGRVWLVSDVDRRFLELEQESVRVISLGVDLDEFPFNPDPSGNVVAFIGNMSFSMNLDACRHFIRDILPALMTRAGIRFRVIGVCPQSVRRELEKHAGVEVTGVVRRIADAVDGVFCGVCPVRAGAGTQSKILNYLALGIPCVMSDIGFEGLSAVNGRDLFVYGHHDHAVDLILKLYEDSSLRRHIAENGRKYVERSHDWKMIERTIHEDVSDLLDAKQSLLVNSHA
jgi:glycosyltransferase involved in cell wall biosynthesis